MLDNLKQSAVEFYLKNFAHKPAFINTEWEINTAQLNNISINWPAKYEWDAASDWVDTLLYGFRKYCKVEIADNIPQPYKGTVVFRFIINGKKHNVAIGYSDYMPVDEDCVKQCDLYFKMQYDKKGYGYTQVIPGGYVPDSPKLYFYLGKLRKLRDLKQYKYEVYGRFGLNAAREIREKAINLLNGQNLFAFEGGMKTVSYKEFLKEVAQSKICIDLPGQGDFCFRLVNYMAVGSCVVAFPHRTALQVPLVDRQHIVYTKDDFSDMVALCEYYLKHDEEREEIARNSRGFFDRYLHKDNLVKYYLKNCLDRLA